MLLFEDLETGENLAFYGAHDLNGPWFRIGKAIKDGNSYSCEAPFENYRYIQLRSDRP